MKKIRLALLIICFSSSSFAAEIKAGRFNTLWKKIELDVTYLYGFTKHNFSLKLMQTNATVPPQAEFQLIDKAQRSQPQMMVQETISFNLDELGIELEKYPFIQITGDKDSKVTIDLR